MTDLTTMLRTEASSLPVPDAPCQEILSSGRSMRRRRRMSRLAAGSTVVILGVAGAVIVQHQSPPPSTFQPVAPAGRLAMNGGAISLDSTLYLDNGRHRALLPERSAGVLYTSAGVLVRTSKSGNTESGDPYRFTLVGPRGGTDQLDLEIGRGGMDAVPSQPYLVRTEVHQGTVDVVVDDVATNSEVARVRLPGHPTWRAHSATPPVSLDGNTAYVATKGTAYAVQWDTGTVEPNRVIGPQFGPVRGGRVVDPSGRRVLDVTTGRTLLRYTPRGVAALSWDGRYLLVPSTSRAGVYVYNISTGHRIWIPNIRAQTWTPNGEVFSTYDFAPLARLKVAVCAPDTGLCTAYPFPYLYRTSQSRPRAGVEEIDGGQWFE